MGMTYQLVKSRLEDQEKRLTKVEDKLEVQVGSPACTRMREECNTEKETMFNVLTNSVERVREQMQAEFKDYREFKGFVNAKIISGVEREHIMGERMDRVEKRGG